MTRSHLSRLSVLCALVIVAGSTGPSHGQIPDTFTNLQLLDPKIEKGRLVGTMRDWANGLGVRCAHCHVGPDNLQGMDFASDDKAAKRTARKMLVMARRINKEMLADLAVVAEDGRQHAQVVSCYTCHRGTAKPPRQVVIELAEAGSRAKENAGEGETGAQAAIARFRELKAEHDNAGRYDLRPHSLFKVARHYLETEQIGGAREVIAALNEMYPDFADGYAISAQVELMTGNRQAAVTALERAEDIEPDNRMAAWIRSRLPPEPTPGQEGDASSEQ